MTTAIGMVTLLSFALGEREMSGESKVEQPEHVPPAPWRTCAACSEAQCYVKGAMPQGTRPQAVRPCDGHA